MLKACENFKQKLIKLLQFGTKKTSAVIDILQAQPLFYGLTIKQLKKLEKDIVIETIDHGGKQIENALIIVLSGQIKLQGTQKNQEVIEYYSGEPINLLSITEEITSVSIAEVCEPSTILILSFKSLRTNSYYKKHIEPILLRNSMRFTFKQFSNIREILSKTNRIATTSINDQLEEVRKRLLFGVFVIRLLIVLSLYTLSLKGLEIIKFKAGHSSSVSTLILCIMAAVVYHIMVQTRLPMSEFGLTSINLRMSIKESLFFSAILIFLCTFVKLLIIQYVPDFHNQPLFDFTLNINENQTIYTLKSFAFLIIYIIFSPIQEFLVRGGLQGALHSFLATSKQNKLWTSIIVSNLMFTTFHIHVSTAFAILSFFPGIIWGWLYSRHKTLIGVSISHALVGTYILFVLGVSNIIPGLQ